MICETGDGRKKEIILSFPKRSRVPLVVWEGRANRVASLTTDGAQV